MRVRRLNAASPALQCITARGLQGRGWRRRRLQRWWSLLVHAPLWRVWRRRTRPGRSGCSVTPSVLLVMVVVVVVLLLRRLRLRWWWLPRLWRRGLLHVRQLRNACMGCPAGVAAFPGRLLLTTGRREAGVCGGGILLPPLLLLLLVVPGLNSVLLLLLLLLLLQGRGRGRRHKRLRPAFGGWGQGFIIVTPGHLRTHVCMCMCARTSVRACARVCPSL